MKKTVILALFAIALVFVSFTIFYKEEPAVKFLKSLDKVQRSKAQLAFDDLSKSKWHFIPSSMWPRKGIQLDELHDHQKELANQLLQSSLSESGYLKTKKIISLENVLLEISGDSVMRNPEKYSFAFYGNPEKDSLWAWSFEGHHISLNFTILNGKASVAPRFFGSNPATVLSGPRKGERPLHKEEDLGFKLINSLSDQQREIAVFQENAFRDIVTRNNSEVEPFEKVGIAYKALNASQQQVFLELLNEYIATVPAPEAKRRMEKIKTEEIGALSFGWAGGLQPGVGHYYRIQGKTFLIEFDNTQNKANHIHTVWRDFNGDFGRDLIKEHYHNADHHKH